MGIALAVEAGPSSVIPEAGATRYLFQLRSSAVQQDIDYFKALVANCASTDVENAKSQFHFHGLALKIAVATLSKPCYNKLVLKDGFVSGLVRLVEIDQKLTPAVPAALPSTGDAGVEVAPGKTNWHFHRLSDKTFPANAAGAGMPHPGDAKFVANGGESVTVYAIGTGIKKSHPEFAGTVAPGKAVTELATCANEEQCGSADGEGCDKGDGAGTAVASLISSAPYGLARKTTVVPVRVVDCKRAGYASGIALAFDWILQQATEGKPTIATVSVSAPYSVIVNNAALAAVAKNITTIVAAGNNDADACTYSPASASLSGDVITVSAVNILKKRSVDANFGPCVTVHAPGSLVSVVAPEQSDSKTAPTYKSGTGLAAGAVSGLAALLLQNKPTLQPYHVKYQLLKNAVTETIPDAKPNTTGRSAFIHDEVADDVCSVECALNGGVRTIPVVANFASPPKCVCRCNSGFSGATCNVTRAEPAGADVFHNVSTVKGVALGVVEEPGYPLNTRAGVQRFQSIYLASDLKALGLAKDSVISQVAFKVYRPPVSDIHDVVIGFGYIPAAHTTLSAFAPLDVVFRGQVRAKAVGAYATFPFTNANFTVLPPWDGESNVVLEYASNSIATFLNTLPGKVGAEDATILYGGSGSVYVYAPQQGFARSLYAFSERSDEAFPYSTALGAKTTRSSRLVPGVRFVHLPADKPCAKVACANDGTCDPATGKCKCVDGLIGDTCAQADTALNAPLCEGVDCGANGICYQGQCTCRNGFTGPFCATAPLAVCTPETCKNGGTCSNTANPQSPCSCLAGFEGPHCEVGAPQCKTDAELVALAGTAYKACGIPETNITKATETLKLQACTIFTPNVDGTDTCRLYMQQLFNCVSIDKPTEKYPDQMVLVNSILAIKALAANYVQFPVFGTNGAIVKATLPIPATANKVSCITAMEPKQELVVNNTLTLKFIGVGAGHIALVREGLSCNDASAVRFPLELAPPPAIPPAGSQAPEASSANVTLANAGSYTVCYSPTNDTATAVYAPQAGATVFTAFVNPGKRSIFTVANPTTVAPGVNEFEVTAKLLPPYEESHIDKVQFALAPPAKCDVASEHVSRGIFVPARSNPDLPYNASIPAFVEVEASAGVSAVNLDDTLRRATLLGTYKFGLNVTTALCYTLDGGATWLEASDKATQIKIGYVAPPVTPDEKKGDECKDKCVGANQRCVKGGTCVCTNGFTGVRCEVAPTPIPSGAVRASLKLTLPKTQAGNLADVGGLAVGDLRKDLAAICGVPETRIKVAATSVAAAGSLIEMSAAVLRVVPSAEADAEAEAEADADAEVDSEDASEVIRRLSRRVVFDDVLKSQSYSFAQAMSRVVAAADDDENQDVRVTFDILPPTAADQVSADAAMTSLTTAIKSKKYPSGTNFAQFFQSASQTCQDGSDPAVTNCGVHDWCEENVAMSCVWFGVLMGACVLVVVAFIVYCVCFRGSGDEWTPAIPGPSQAGAARTTTAGDDFDATHETRPLVGGAGGVGQSDGWDADYNVSQRRGAASKGRHAPNRHS